MIDKIEKSTILRRSVIIGHRRRKNLCERCGKDLHDNTECEEDYSITDTRIKTTAAPQLDEKKKKDTIIAYRKKKLLCEVCGCELHPGACFEDYTKSDNRSEVEKLDRPATIPTPKFKPVTILEKIQEDEIMVSKIQFKPTQQIKLQRDFIVLNINKSKNEKTVDFNCLNVLSRRLPNYIVCVLGNIEKEFPLSDCMRIKKLTNIFKIPNTPQDIINYLMSCKKFFSFENEYTVYCDKNSISVYLFDENKNATNFLKDNAFVI